MHDMAFEFASAVKMCRNNFARTSLTSVLLLFLVNASIADWHALFRYLGVQDWMPLRSWTVWVFFSTSVVVVVNDFFLFAVVSSNPTNQLKCKLWLWKELRRSHGWRGLNSSLCMKYCFSILNSQACSIIKSSEAACLIFMELNRMREDCGMI